jgi:predicted permease
MHRVKGAIRQLTQRPLLAAVIVLTLALGIGANAAMFSLFHQVLLRPLPVPDSGRLVNLASPGPKLGSISWDNMGGGDYVFSYPMLRDLEREQTVFTGIAAHHSFNASIAAEGSQAVRADAIAVNGDYFNVLQLAPALGRLIGKRDEPRVDEAQVTVLSYEYWQNRFGGDPGVIGSAVTVNGQPLTVIGIAPEGFSGTSFGERPGIFVPLTLRWLMQPSVPRDAENRRAYWVYLFARLKPGVTMGQAEEEINGPYRAIINDVEAPIMGGMSDQMLAQFREGTIRLEPGARGQSSTPERSRLPLTLLFSVTALVLSIACVNVANLLLVRGSARAGEMAVRASLGATRADLIAQLLLEAGLLGLLGCVAGLPIAAATLHFIGVVAPPQAAAIVGAGLSDAAILFAIGVSLATVLAFGLFPALAATRRPTVTVLNEQAGQQSGGRALSRFRGGLVTAQIAFSMVLLVLAGLFTQSLANIASVDLGLRPDTVATFSLSPALNGYEPEQSREVIRRIEEELAALPGVTSVATAQIGVITGQTRTSNVSVQGFEAAPDAETNANYNVVGPGFFRTLQIPLLSGRDFSDADIAGRPRVAIVNEKFANKLGPDVDVVGKQMAIGSGVPLDIEIVGLVRDAKYSDVKEEVPPQYFLSRFQEEERGYVNFYARTELDPGDLLTAMTRVVAEVDVNLPVGWLSTLPSAIRDRLFLDRLIGMLSSGFAALATLLAAVGLYGVLSYSVTQRTRELGLRQALGATPQQLRRMVLRQVGWMGLIGGVAGLALALISGRAAEAVLFGLKGYDPAVLAAATIILGAVVLTAGYLPARQASNTNPLEALRYE